MPVNIGDLKVYTVPEVAELLDIQEKTVRRFLREGVFHGRKLAGRWYVSEPDLQAYFTGQADSGGSGEGEEPAAKEAEA